jgi:hypothetical protein
LENLSNLAALWEKALALFFGLPQANDSRVAFILNFELGNPILITS